jgi:predicted phage-related endonuclease
MAIEIIPIENRPQWLALRQKDITASTVGGLLGVSGYQTPFSLFALKTGQIAEESDEPQLEENAITLSPMARGTLLEDKAAELLRILKPGWIVKKGTDYYRDPGARIGATPDLICLDDDGRKAVVQVKNPEASIYRMKWRQEDGSIEPPLDYVAQAIVEAHLTGAELAYVGALVISHKTEFRLVPVPIHEGLITKIRDVVADFWRRVAESEPYAPDYARDGALIAMLNSGVVEGKTIDLSSDNHLPEIAAEDSRLAAEIKERTERRAAIKAEFLSKLGDASAATFQGGSVSAALIRRKAYSVKESSYRQVRVKLGA